MWAGIALILLLWQSEDPGAAGMKALEARNYEAAAAAFRKAVEAAPDDYAARFHLALSLSLLDRDGEAIPEYRKVLELQPGLYEAELNLGILLVRRKQHREAAPLLEAAAAKKPAEFRPVYYLAQARYACGDFTGAEASFSKAAELDPKSAGAALGWGKSLARQGRLKDAEAQLRRAAQLDPSFRDGLLELAALHEERKEPAAAIAIYREFPELPAARERLGQLLLESGQAAQAIPELREAVAKSPTAANRAALAAAYLRNQEPDKAVPLLEQALAAEPGAADLRLAHGRALRDLKNYPAAAREFLRAAQLKPDSAEAFGELAAMLILLENFPQAIAALDRVRALGAEKPGHLYLRAIVLDRLRDYKPALESYRGFLERSAGQNPEEEFKARQRVRILEKELSKR